MDYMSLLQHVSEVLDAQFPDIEIKVLYLAKANAVPKMSPLDLRKNGFGVVSVCRATEFDMMRRTLGAKWNGLIQCVEDTAVLDASMDIVTSRKVRENMRKGRSIEVLAGTAIDQYVRNHDLGKKMTGDEEYNDDEKAMPDIPSRPARVYVYCDTMVLPSFFSRSLLLSACLPSLTPHGMSLTIIPLPQSIIYRHNTHIPYYNTTGTCAVSC